MNIQTLLEIKVFFETTLHKTHFISYSVGHYENLLQAQSAQSSKNLLDLNLTKDANSAYLKTELGEVEVFLDMYEDNDALGVGKISQMKLLLNLDSNKDGFLSADDALFDKLKVKGYDKDGNEKISKLSDVIGSIDLEKFIKKQRVNAADTISDDSPVDSRIRANESNPYNIFKAEYRYKKVEDESIKSFFKAHAGDDGWVDLRDKNIFGKEFSNFAYVKNGLSGDLELSEFNPIYETILDKKHNSYTKERTTYVNHQKANFERFYKDYESAKAEHKKIQNEMIAKLESIKGADTDLMAKLVGDGLAKIAKLDTDKLIDAVKSTSSSLMIAMQNDFKNMTGLDFSEENLQKVKQMFDSNAKAAAYGLKEPIASRL